MMNAPIEYQSSAQVKIERRPNQPPSDNSVTRRRVWRDGGSRSSRAATVTAGPVAISLPPSIFRQRHSRLPPRYYTTLQAKRARGRSRNSVQDSLAMDV